LPFKSKTAAVIVAPSFFFFFFLRVAAYASGEDDFIMMLAVVGVITPFFSPSFPSRATSNSSDANMVIGVRQVSPLPSLPLFSDFHAKRMSLEVVRERVRTHPISLSPPSFSFSFSPPSRDQATARKSRIVDFFPPSPPFPFRR